MIIFDEISNIVKVIDLDLVSKIQIIKYCLYSYLTFWVIFIQFLFYIGYLKKYQFSIFILTLLTSICGFFISHINPKKLIIPIINIELSDELIVYLDIIFHHLPLLLFAIIYDKNIKKDNLSFCFLVIIIYLLFNNPIKKYHIIINK